MTKRVYEDAGVSIAAGEEITEQIKSLAHATHGPNVLHGLGLFSGFYQLQLSQYIQPVLVASIDGVGTKVKVAEMMGIHDSVGQDLVNHCVNDIAVCGAEPLFFTDYIAADRLEPATVRQLVKGISIACEQAKCALIGGETAEMPGVYSKGSFDLAGAITGVVEKSAIIDGRKIAGGDVLIGVQSNGLHTNGFSLVRKVLFEDEKYSVNQYLDETGCKLGEELLRVHRSYLPVISRLKNESGIHGIAHITGGGIAGNTRRLLKAELSLHIDWDSWEKQPIFDFIARVGNVSDTEMRQVFNLGIGLVLLVAATAVDTIQNACAAEGFENWVIGSVQ